MTRPPAILRACALAVLVAMPARAEQDPIATERSLLEVIQATRAKQREEGASQAEAEEEGETRAAPKDDGGKPTRHWAILPQIGLSPEKGAHGGIKLTDRDITPLHLTLDLAGSAAVRGQARGDVILISPSFGSDWLMLLAEGEFYTDPTKEFFGLGNNEVGPDELSTNRHERIYGTLALGLRVSRRFALVVSGAYNEVQVKRGRREDDVPSTVDVFPNLNGIGGGRTNPLSFSLLFNDRQDLARPTRGWSIIAKASWVPRGLGNDFEYARYLLDASYLYPLLTRRQVLGVHLGGQYLDARRRQIPFYELASLGGSHDLRGFFQDRFLGDSAVVVNAEYRLKLIDFKLFWDVQIDGVAFGDAGRVFFEQEDIVAELGEPVETIPRTDDDFRYSYGGGLRIALGEALVARLDVGFSEEEKGLVYLVFGHTF